MVDCYCKKKQDDLIRKIKKNIPIGYEILALNVNSVNMDLYYFLAVKNEVKDGDVIDLYLYGNSYNKDFIILKRMDLWQINNLYNGLSENGKIKRLPESAKRSEKEIKGYS